MLNVLVAVGLISLMVAGFGNTVGAEALLEDVVAVPMPSTHTHRGNTGDIEELKDGSLLFVYTHGGIVGRKSLDGGRTWGPEFEVQRNVAKLETCCANLERLANGELLLGYLLINNYTGPEYRYYSGPYYVRRSSDEGQTWGHPICVTMHYGFHTIQPDCITQLSSGRILAPAEWTLEVGGGEAGHMVSLCYFSDDGHIWLRGKGHVDIGATTEEPSVVELKDGRLLMIFRSTRGYVGRAYSEDQGDTWSEPEFLELPSPMANQLITRIPSTGDLLLLWCNNPHSPGRARGEEQPVVAVAQLQRKLGDIRSPLTAAVSQDEGQTWPHIRNIAEDPEGVYGDYGYPGCTFVEDGTVAIINYHALDGLHVARIGVDWFYGK